jgi:hypothetical protein
MSPSLDTNGKRLGETTEDEARGERDAKLKNKPIAKSDESNLRFWVPFVHYGA